MKLQKGLGAAKGGFVPARLTLARAARGIKQRELALALERSPTLVSKWENDEHSHSPDASDLERLSATLSVQISWFFKPFDLGASASFFRSLRSELKSARDRSAAKLVFLHEIFCALEKRIEFPEVDLPIIPEATHYREITSEQIDRIASRAREYWGLGDDPIDDLMTVIENAGIVVGDDFLVSTKLDGVSRWFHNTPVMLLAKDKDTGVRRRFDAAHELGHIILHRTVTANQLLEDWRLIEDQAMAFASAFLMPASSFAQSTSNTTLDGIADLKPVWKVSIAAMMVRLKSLNLVDEAEAKNLWKYYSYRKWRGDEPHDDAIEFESPVNLKSGINMLIEDGPAETDTFMSETGLLAEDIISLTGASIELPSARRRPKLRVIDSNISAAND